MKLPQIRKIVEAEEDCETKLHNIRNLLGVSNNTESPRLTISPPAVTNSEAAEVPSVPSNHDKIENVLKEFSSHERKDALAIIELINTSSGIDWNPETFELKIDDEVLKFTDLRLLLKAIVATTNSTLPVGLCLLIEKLLELKLPYVHYRGGNSIAIRNSLIKILGRKTLPSPDESGKGGVDVNLTVEGVTSDTGHGKRKHDLDDDDDADGDVRQAKRQKEDVIDNENVTGNASNAYNVSLDRLKGLRRSARLRKEIADVWKSNDGRKKYKRKV